MLSSWQQVSRSGSYYHKTLIIKPWRFFSTVNKTSANDSTAKPQRDRTEIFRRRTWDINELRRTLSDAPTMTDIINREKSIPFLAATSYREFSEIASKYFEESRTFETVIPLSKDTRLRKLYENPFGLLRIGRVLEDLDAVSALAALYHVGRDDVNCVTAAVDGVRLHGQPWNPCLDLVYHSKVTYTGKTSMNISLTVRQIVDEKDSSKLIMEADFVYVARNLEGTESIPVPRLEARNEEEKASFERAALKQMLRKERAKHNLEVSVPTIDEQLQLHEMFRRGIKQEEEMYMSQVSVSSTHFMLPDERNMYGFTFGGVLMRRAYELAFVNDYMACLQRPSAVEVGDIHFIKSVPVGSILELHSSVVYTRDSYQVVLVDAMVNNVMKTPPTKERTNTFNFILKTDYPVKRIFPVTYEESMKYISGKRLMDDVLARI